MAVLVKGKNLARTKMPRQSSLMMIRRLFSRTRRALWCKMLSSSTEASLLRRPTKPRLSALTSPCLRTPLSSPSRGKMELTSHVSMGASACVFKATSTTSMNVSCASTSGCVGSTTTPRPLSSTVPNYAASLPTLSSLSPLLSSIMMGWRIPATSVMPLRCFRVCWFVAPGNGVCLFTPALLPIPLSGT
jgi:hypothetical protein